MTNTQDNYLTTFLLVTLTHDSNRDESHYRILDQQWNEMSKVEQFEVLSHIKRSTAPKDLRLIKRNTR